MDTTHLHLLLNHAPVAGVAFGLFFLLFGIWKRSSTMRLSAITLFVISSLLVIPVFMTGEPSEDRVEGLPGVSESIIETHEDSAKMALTAMLVLGGVSVVSLVTFAKKKAIPNSLVSTVGVLAVVAMGFIGRTAYLGGQIRHTEIRAGAPTTGGQDAGGEQQNGDDD